MRDIGTRGSALLRTLLVLLLFGIITIPLVRVGRTESPATTALRRLGTSPDLAVVGDSRAHVGISPTAIADALAEDGLPRPTAYNFAVDGTDVLHHRSFVAHDLLSGGTAPRVILWAPNPLSFDGSRQQNRLEQLRLTDLPALVRAHAPQELCLDVLTMGLFPAYRHRPLVQKELDDREDGAADRLLAVQRRGLGLRVETKPRSREYEAQGDGQEPFRVLAEWQDRFDRGEAAYRVDYARLSVADWKLALGRDLARRARAAGALLVIVETPLSPTYRNTLARTAKHERFREAMRTIAAEEGAVYRSDAARFDRDDDFGDPGHMHEATARAYSTYLGHDLANDSRVKAALSARAGQTSCFSIP